jgi:hypothetical protein
MVSRRATVVEGRSRTAPTKEGKTVSKYVDKFNRSKQYGHADFS